MPLDATTGGNSFVTVAEADAYFADSLYSDSWTSVSSKDAALVTATRYLCMLKLYNTDGSLIIVGDTIPEDVQYATHELGLYLNDNFDQFNTQDTTTRIKVAVIEIENELLSFGELSSLPMRVRSLIDPYLSASSSGFTLERC